MKRQVKELVSFFSQVLCLKKVRRSGWFFKVGVTSPESVADHSFCMCIMAMVISDLSGMDTERAMKMAILHDLGESIIGDFMPDEILLSNKRFLENKAILSILEKLPNPLRGDYEKIWDEYSNHVTDLSHLIHRIDKLEMAFQARDYVRDGYSRRKLSEFTDSARRTIICDRKDLISEVLQGLNAATAN
ncbi:MAG: HD domain-containing protein [Thermoproteota archaeon]|nr:HD domain-containing protein [Thermoproteota archaeon]